MKCTRCLSASDGDCIIRGKVYPLCRSCAQPVVAHITSTPTMTREAISTPYPIVSRGKVFQIMACGAEAWHPSFWSFSDELETRELWWDIKPGDVVADVGADFGSYTLSALAQGAAHVFAWSPPFKVPNYPIECETMARSAQLNGWENYTRLSLFASGLWSCAGWLACRDWSEGSSYFQTEEEASAHAPNGVVFEVQPLDALNIQKLDWLKCDAEGAELEILKGATGTLRRCKPAVMLENHVHIDPDCDAKCREFLAGLGYAQVGETRPHHSISHSLYRVTT